MLLSEIEQGYELECACFEHVIADIPALNPRVGLSFISFSLLIEEDDNISLDLIDALIAYETIADEVVLEVTPEHLDRISLDSILITCQNIGVNIALIPKQVITCQNIGVNIALIPKQVSCDDVASDDASSIQLNQDEQAAYIKYSNDMLLHWLSERNRIPHIYPVSSFFEYLTGEVMGFIPKEKTSSSYIKNTFFVFFNNAFEETYKEAMRQSIYTAFGGVSEFEKSIRAITLNAAMLVQEQVNADSRKAASEETI